MVPDQYQRPYLDSTIFIGWIKGEVVDRVDRQRVATHLLTLAERKVFKIYICAVTLAEVHKRRRDPVALTPDQDERILEFFEHDFFEVMDVDRQIGEEANRLCRQLGLLPNDAIHLACALRGRSDVLLTWDKSFAAKKHPGIRIEEPQILGQLSLPESGSVN